MTLSLVKFQSFHLVHKIWNPYIIHSDLKIWFIHINTLYQKMSLVYANQIKKRYYTKYLSLFGNLTPPKKNSLILCHPHFSVHVNFRNAIFFMLLHLRYIIKQLLQCQNIWTLSFKFQLTPDWLFHFSSVLVSTLHLLEKHKH